MSLGLHVKRVSSTHREGIAREHFRKIEHLIISWEVPLQCCASLVTFDVRSLVLKMKQRPNFEARIRDGELNRIRRGELSRLVELGMFIYVEDPPNLVQFEILIALPYRLLRSLLPEADCDLDDGSRLACLTGYFDMNAWVAHCMLECL